MAIELNTRIHQYAGEGTESKSKQKPVETKPKDTANKAEESSLKGLVQWIRDDKNERGCLSQTLVNLVAIVLAACSLVFLGIPFYFASVEWTRQADELKAAAPKKDAKETNDTDTTDETTQLKTEISRLQNAIRWMHGNHADLMQKTTALATKESSTPKGSQTTKASGSSSFNFSFNKSLNTKKHLHKLVVENGKAYNWLPVEQILNAPATTKQTTETIG